MSELVEVWVGEKSCQRYLKYYQKMKLQHERRDNFRDYWVGILPLQKLPEGRIVLVHANDVRSKDKDAVARDKERMARLASRCCVVMYTHDTSEQDFAELRVFPLADLIGLDEAGLRAKAEESKQPSEPDKVILLSSAIHSLENAVLPLRADVQTLSETREEHMVREIWEAYFGESEEGSYLLKGRRFGDVRGLEAYVVSVLHGDRGKTTPAALTVKNVPKADQEPVLFQLLAQIAKDVPGSEEERLVQESAVAKALRMEDARERALGSPGQNREGILREVLPPIVESFDKLIGALRKAREVSAADNPAGEKSDEAEGSRA